jgi:hypothetical protein
MPAIRLKVLSTPAFLTAEDLGVSELATARVTDPLLAMRAAVVRHDRRAARAAGGRFTSQLDAVAPGTMGIDRMTAYSRMLLSIGDTAEATRQLDAALNALSRARTILLEVTPQAGAVGRTLLLRAQLALAARDRPTARRRFAQVDALWRHADPELRAKLEAVRRQL